MTNHEQMMKSIADICIHFGIRQHYSADVIASLVGAIPFDMLFHAIRDQAEPVYAYCTNGTRPLTLTYRGRNLFGRSATLLWQEPTLLVEDTDLVTTRYLELWLLEDMTPAVVSCMQIDIGEEADYTSEYREYKGSDWPSSEPAPELMDFLNRLADFCPESDTPGEDVIYES